MDARSSALEEFRRRLRAGDLEGALRALRDGGYSKVESMVEIARTGACTMEAAKRTVHESRAWQDVRARDEDFHERLVSTIEDERFTTALEDAPPDDDVGSGPR